MRRKVVSEKKLEWRAPEFRMVADTTEATRSNTAGSHSDGSMGYSDVS